MSLDVLGLPAALLKAIWRHHLGETSASEELTLASLGLTRLEGGNNNLVYAFRWQGVELVCKLYKEDGRQRDRREWEALRLLAALDPPLAPRAYHYDPSHRPPLILMERVAGEPLGGRALTPEMLAALADAVRRLSAITPEAAPTTHWFALEYAYLRASRLREAERELVDTRDALGREAHALLAAWLAGSGRLAAAAALSLDREAVRVAFSPGDPSPANLLWDGRRLRWIDFEYSGWGDPIFWLGDLVEHDQSRATSDEAWDAFLEGFDLSVAERRRLAEARRLIALFWMVKLWALAAHASDEAPRERLAQQIERARRLLGG